MSARPASTIVLITREGLVRADFSSGPKQELINIWQDARPEVDDAASLVELTLSFGGRPGRQVWVLSSDFWSQALALPTARTVGITSNELAGALNFEAEALSGSNAFECSLGQVFQKSKGGDSIYRVVQVKTADRERIDDAVRAAGGRLAGLSHPGGLPRPLFPTGAVDTTWERVELWPDIVVYLHGDGKEAPDVQLLNVDPQHGRWQNAVDKVRSEIGPIPAHRELMAAEQITTPTGYASVPVLQLDNPASLGKWLTAWNEQLCAPTADVPLIRPGVRPLSTPQTYGIALLLTVLVIGLCTAHYFLFMKPHKAYMEAEKVKAGEPKRTFDDLDKRTKELSTKRDALQKQESKIHQDIEALTRQRRRLSDLLRVLAEQHVEHLCIQSIDSGMSEPRLFGMCLRPELADEFARRLAEVLKPQGWDVELVRKEAKILQHDGSPWSFELQLHDVSANVSNLTASQAAPSVPPRRR